MKKLYRYNEKQQRYFYDEAWVDGETIVEHVGKLGTRGRTISHRRSAGVSAEDDVLRVLQPGIRGGYKEIPINSHSTLIVEYEVDGFGTPSNVAKRHALEGRLDNILGWTGLGHCDGGSIGSGTMEAFCLVVDFDLAKGIIEEELAGTEFGNFRRIYRGKPSDRKL